MQNKSWWKADKQNLAHLPMELTGGNLVDTARACNGGSWIRPTEGQHSRTVSSWEDMVGSLGGSCLVEETASS